MAVNPNNQTVGVRTDFDRLPIIRGIARSIAFDKAQELKGQSEAIAARKLANQALPRFESEVGGKFQDANSNLQDNFLKDLEERGIAPESYSTRSSETHLAMSTRTIGPTSLSSAMPPDAPAPRRGIAIQAHESVINAALTSLKLGGPTTPVQLIETIEEALEDLADKKLELRRPEEKDKQADFDFEAEDPIRVRFDENRIVLLFRTGFYQYDKGEERPEQPTLDKQVFEIPIEVTFENGEIILTPPPLDNLKEFGAKIKQRPADSTKSKGAGALRRTIQARKIAHQLVTAVFNDPDNPDAKDKRVPAEIEVLMGDGTRLKLRVTKFQVSDGWITAVFNK